MIYIISATEFEILKLKDKLTENSNVKFIITGIGIFNATFNFLNFLNNNNISKHDIFINTGIAGGFLKQSILKFCFAEQEILSDFGICFNNRVEYFSELPEKTSIKSSLTDFLKERYCFDYSGNFLTVNCVSTDEKRIEFYKNYFNPVCENMEGFAIAYICKKFNLNFAEIRVISNYIGERNNWRTKEAVEKLSNFLYYIVLDLNENFNQI